MSEAIRCTLKKASHGGSAYYVPDPNGEYLCKEHRSSHGTHTTYYEPVKSLRTEMEYDSEIEPPYVPPTYTQGKTRARKGAELCRVLCELRKYDFVLVAVLFPKVDKFGGMKLFLYEENVWDGLQDKKKIDPHFYPDKKSCLVRLRPDTAGLSVAARLLDVSLTGIEMAPFRAVLVALQK